MNHPASDINTPYSTNPTAKNALEKYANNKVIPNQLREEILCALAYYPELIDTHIEFRFSNRIRNSVMLAQPRLSTMWKPKAERGYVIKMNTRFRLGGDHLKIETLPRDVLIGWVGHELGHVMDYLHRNAFEMLKFGIGYSFSRKYIMGAERAADTYAVEHGLASKIIAAKNFILDHAKIPKRYKAKIRRLYLSPDDIMLLVEEAETHPSGSL